MAREPDLVVFKCDSCGFQTDADSRTGSHLLPWKRRLPIEPTGRCKSCGGEMWTVSVVYAQSGLDVEASAIGIGLAAATGTGFTQTSTSTSQSDYTSMQAAVVAKLNESPPERMQRVAASFAGLKRPCPECGEKTIVPAS